MKTNAAELFPWSKDDEEVYKEAIKWKQGTTSYEVYHETLEGFEIADLIPHVLSVKNKVMKAVGTDTHKAPSLFRVFPRTLKPVLQGIWDQVVNDAHVAVETEDAFDGCAKNFIGLHSTEEDTHALLQQLRNATKPRQVGVQSYWYKMRELNGYVPWMLGNKEPLEEEEIKQAFHDAMPEKWRDRYTAAGKTITSESMAEVVQYFRLQERKANIRQSENETTQKKSKQKGTKRKIHESDRKPHKGSNGGSKKKEVNGRIANDDPCPIHHYLSEDKRHTWGECYSGRHDTQNRVRSIKIGATKCGTLSY
jgi:hypothetical protein